MLQGTLYLENDPYRILIDTPKEAHLDPFNIYSILLEAPKEALIDPFKIAAIPQRVSTPQVLGPPNRCTPRPSKTPKSKECTLKSYYRYHTIA